MEPQMNTEQSAATKKNLTAETQRTRRSRPWERTLPACPGCPTPCTQDAGCVRSQEPAEENPLQAGREFSTDGKRFVILRVFVSSWWIGGRLYHEGAKTRRSAKFLVTALLLCVHLWFRSSFLLAA